MDSVIVRFEYTAESRKPLDALLATLRQTIAEAGVGELEDFDIADDLFEGCLYLYGSDADALLAVVRPHLDSADCLRQVRAKLQYSSSKAGAPQRLEVITADPKDFPDEFIGMSPPSSTAHQSSASRAESVKTYEVDLSRATDHPAFVKAFNDGFIRYVGGEWHGQSWDAVEDYLRWSDEPFRIVWINSECLDVEVRAILEVVVEHHPQLTNEHRRDVRRLPYGREFAERIADALAAGLEILYQHRDYCGMGLRMLDGQFCYGRVQEGYLDRQSDPNCRLFASREEFIDWMAEQSDLSLDGHEEAEAYYRDNQRLTRERIESALRSFSL